MANPISLDSPNFSGFKESSTLSKKRVNSIRHRPRPDLPLKVGSLTCLDEIQRQEVEDLLAGVPSDRLPHVIIVFDRYTGKFSVESNVTPVDSLSLEEYLDSPSFMCPN